MRTLIPLALIALAAIAIASPQVARAQAQEEPAEKPAEKSANASAKTRTQASAKRPHDGLRLAPYVGVLAGGKRIVSSSSFGVSGSSALLAGFGVGARLEKGLHDYFVLGGRIELSNDRAEIQDMRSIFLDLDLLPKARYLLNARGVDWEFYFAVPLGLSFGFYPLTTEREHAAGFNTGFLGGVQVLFEKAGLFVDLGLRYRAARYQINETILGVVRVREAVGIRTRQFNLNIGGIIYF